MRFSVIYTIAHREYTTRVKTWSFVVMTLLVPLLLAGSFIVPRLLSGMKATDRTVVVAVADETGLITSAMDHLSADGSTFKGLPIASDSTGLASGRKMVIDETVDALLHVPAGVLTDGHAVWITAKSPSRRDLVHIRDLITNEVTAHRLRASGFKPSVVRSLTRSVRVEAEILGVTKGSGSFVTVLFSAMGLAILIYFSLMMYGAGTMRSVIEDKTSRVIELLVSTATPTEILAGKIVGLGLAGTTQVAIWVVAATIAGFATSGSGAGALVSSVLTASLPWFVAYYVFGFLLYSTLYASVGAACSSQEDAQQLQWPIMLLLMVPIFLLGAVVSDPGRPLFVWLSWVPFFSPVLMMIRHGMGHVGWIEMLGALILMALTGLVTTWMAGRVFRVGLLMTGKRPTVRELWRWIRAG
jgi:ABC-2 type transport system permease protein